MSFKRGQIVTYNRTVRGLGVQPITAIVVNNVPSGRVRIKLQRRDGKLTTAVVKPTSLRIVDGEQ
jgi:hypothetical protein